MTEELLKTLLKEEKEEEALFTRPSESAEFFTIFSVSICGSPILRLALQ